MKTKWTPVIIVFLAAVGLITYKQTRPRPSPAPVSDQTRDQRSTVILVANLGEADDNGDVCGDIIRAVRAAGKDGIPVQEFNSDSKSDVLTRYRVLVTPTVLVVDPGGQVLARYEGEDRTTLAAIRSNLNQLTRTKP